MSSLRKAILVPFLLPLISAVSEKQSFTITIGPCLDGRDIQIDFRFYAEEYETCFAFVDVTGTTIELPIIGLTQKRVAALSKDEDGFCRLKTTLSEGLFNVNSILRFRVGICRQYYVRNLDWNRFPYMAYADVGIDLDHGLLRVDEEGQVRSNTRYYFCNVDYYTGFDGIYQESYFVEGVAKEKYIPNRRFPLSEISVQCENRYAEMAEVEVAELRILSHMEDFASVSEDHHGYRSIELKANIARDGDNHVYTFSLAKPLYYSRIDLKAYEAKPDIEPSFRSENLYIPLRLGHDNALYEYQIHLKGIGAFGDEMIIDNSILSTASYFGNCLSSTYCVVIGD